MKKILTLLLLATLLLTACTNENPPLAGDTDGETTLAPTDAETTMPQDAETTTPEDVETTTPEEESSTSSNISKPFVEPLFINYYDVTLNDLYKLLTVRSNEPNDYEGFSQGGGGPLNVLLKTMPDANVLIKLEDMNLQSEALMDDFEGVQVSVKNPVGEYINEDYYEYYYMFDRSKIHVFYAPERLSKNSPDFFGSSIEEGGLSAFLDNPSVSKRTYTEKIGDYYVGYRRSIQSSTSRTEMFAILTEDFCIRIYRFLNQEYEKTPYEDVEKLFSEETYRDAILQLIEGIENRE